MPNFEGLDDFARRGTPMLKADAETLAEKLHESVHRWVLDEARGLTPFATGEMRRRWKDSEQFNEGQSRVWNDDPGARAINAGTSRTGSAHGSPQAPRGITRPLGERLEAHFNRLAAAITETLER